MGKLLFTAGLTLSLLLAGCGAKPSQKAVPQAVVKPTKQTVLFPKTTDIRHVYVIAGLAARPYAPKNTSDTVTQIENWLKNAKPVVVQLPPLPNPPIVTGANTNPAVLELQLSSKDRILISPTFYMVRDSQEVYQFVDGVISYHVGNITLYFKDPNLYNWLKSNKWTQQFYTN